MDSKEFVELSARHRISAHKIFSLFVVIGIICFGLSVYIGNKKAEREQTRLKNIEMVTERSKQAYKLINDFERPIYRVEDNRLRAELIQYLRTTARFMDESTKILEKTLNSYQEDMVSRNINIDIVTLAYAEPSSKHGINPLKQQTIINIIYFCVIPILLITFLATLWIVLFSIDDKKTVWAGHILTSLVGFSVGTLQTILIL